MKLILTTFTVFIFGNLFCQITIVNSSKSPISSVKLYTSKQILIAQSDGNGSIEWHKIKNQLSSDTIFFKHVEYETKWALKSKLKMGDSIVLSQRIQELPEFVLTTSKIVRKFQLINACYRSFQLNNDSLIYYTDGLVDYYTKTNKSNYQKKLKENRTYTDSAYIQDIKKQNYMMIFKIARVPPPLPEYLPKKYFKQNKLILVDQGNDVFNILTKDKIKIGTIEKDSNFVTYFINDIYSNRLRKSPKYEANQLKSEITLVFKISNNSNLLIENFDNLVYSKIYRQYDYRYNSDKEFTKIANVEEIFVENIQFLDSVDSDSFNNRFGFPQKSNYETNFWERCNCKFYYPPLFF